MKSHKPEDRKQKHKILIVDDHPIVRQGLAQLINQEAGFTVCGEASDIPSALQAIRAGDPDIMIVDISLGQSSGIRLVEEIMSARPSSLILVLSMHDESLYAERCFAAGARGYLMKQEPPEKVILAIKKILNGEVYISDRLSARLLQKFVTKQPDAYSSPIERLSNRELEVFQLIGQGLKTRRIAEELNLSVKTIETYIEHIKRKMDLDDSRDLILHAVQWHMDKQS
ncbi:MAG: DNA-binding response regulator [Nitrospiraceae bacterium]|nr:MAG: DNA-binding response regulator [Nitrospiraceae bacterium]